MSRRATIALISVFVLSRLVLGYLAGNPEGNPLSGAEYTADVDRVYHDAARRIVDLGEAPYVDFEFEYPPGVLPFVTLPEYLPSPWGYRTVFIVAMVLVDSAGLVGVMLLSRRWGSALGPWLWVALLPLIGPTTYLRLDMIPAVATIWTIERASTLRWSAVGGWLGFGTMAKLYPVALLPLAILASRQRLRVIAWTAGVSAAIVAVTLSVFGGSLSGMLHDVVGRQGGRGLHIESMGGSILLLLTRAGVDVPTEFSLNTTQFIGPVAAVVKLAAGVLSVGAVTLGTALVRPGDEDGARSLGAASFATIALLLGLGTVFSPQFMIWVAALGAVTACRSPSSRWSGFVLLVPAAVLTQIVYPGYYHGVVERELPMLIVLLTRNLLVLAAGVWTVIELVDEQGPGGRLAAFRAKALSRR